VARKRQTARLKRRQTTIQDIARKLGLSSMTVSRALSGHPAVKEETRRRVLELAEKLRYRPNRWARSLVTGKSRTIGIVVPDISHSFFSEITRGVKDAIQPCGYGLMLCNSDCDPKLELQEIEMLLGARVDGLIVASEQPEGSPDVFVDLQTHGVPFVLIDRFFSSFECPRVVVDDLRVGSLATQYLIDLGHQRIAHIRGPDVSTAKLREQGYRSTVENTGLGTTEDWIASGNYQFDGGYEGMKALLSQKPRLTAVFAANDPTAIGAIRACREAGFEIPGDISIIGAGVIEGSYHPSPFLTTVDWPRREMGRQAAELLLQLISDGPEPKQTKIVYEPKLLVRKSTAPLRQ
jgi:LacI family transcriptional regulator